MEIRLVYVARHAHKPGSPTLSETELNEVLASGEWKIQQACWTGAGWECMLARSQSDAKRARDKLGSSKDLRKDDFNIDPKILFAGTTPIKDQNSIEVYRSLNDPPSTKEMFDADWE